jgi:hypothetical protein
MMCIALSRRHPCPGVDDLARAAPLLRDTLPKATKETFPARACESFVALTGPRLPGSAIAASAQNERAKTSFAGKVRQFSVSFYTGAADDGR